MTPYTKPTAVFLAVALSFRLFGTEFTPPATKTTVSADGQFKLVVDPPRFRRNTSYQFFQDQNFIFLRAAEGRNAVAAVRLTLLRAAGSERYFEMWSRFSPSTIIPQQIHVLSAGGTPVIVLEGKYASKAGDAVPFTVFNEFGTWITNGAYSASLRLPTATNSRPWSFDGKLLKLIGRGGESEMAFPVFGQDRN